MECLSDTGCSRTVFAKDVADKFGIPIQPNVNKDRLQTANRQDLHVNGVITLRATYKARTITVRALVTDDLIDEIIVSWHDAHSLGAVTIDGLEHPAPEHPATPRCNKISATTLPAINHVTKLGKPVTDTPTEPVTKLPEPEPVTEKPEPITEKPKPEPAPANKTPAEPANNQAKHVSPPEKPDPLTEAEEKQI